MLFVKKLKGLKVERRVLKDEKLNSRRFDIITMFGVLEHLFEPARDLKIIHTMLNDDGLFMGITPNAQSLVGLILHEHARFYTPRNHPIIFSFGSSRYLLETSGFEVIHLDTVLTGYDSIINWLQYKEPFGELKINFLPPRFGELASNKNRFEQLILEWDLGLRLRVIARKVSS